MQRMRNGVEHHESVMITMTTPLCNGSLPEVHSTGMVSPNLLRGLAECGYPYPLRSLMDARIDYPEILLCSGWNRESTLDGAKYTWSSECNNASQSIEIGPGRELELRTSVYGLTQVIARRGDGTVEEWHE